MVSFAGLCHISDNCSANCDNWFFYFVQGEFNNAINNPGYYHSFANELNNNTSICYEVKEVMF